ncbi:MAG: inorganic phosphate transporter [Pseudomonadales bacterium]|nr:inorganic phosphate transporter [Pseudomonadales bacterium]MDP4639788.1 inorganic phosphate transporter [Pseudomonadales bacterium]MDP4765090.1 inorganic phosphate transporter [Pseudomonadales bacterium]MDP4874858.1 inorganic phosphate transporter [Pseudomonadales bacterium]MDP5058422.1 inorganic phosphate transporter [Pseudomonadales bacterium]
MILQKPDNTSLFFGALLLSTSAFFLIWGFDYLQGSHTLVFLLASCFGIFMAFNIGGNDVANSFGTSVGAGTLTMKQALAVAAVFEISGAVLAGGAVTNTIRGSIVDLSGMTVEPMQFVYVMMSALLAAALWLLFATRRGYPVSTTHSIIGGIVGSSVMLGVLLGGGDSALELVHWEKIGSIAASWVISPLMGGLASYALYFMIKQHILIYNEQAEQKLIEIKQEKRDHKESHKTAFERLDELQQVAYASALARDGQVYQEADFDASDLESDYFQKLKQIEDKKIDVAAHQALEKWVPLAAALGAVVISAMLLFKGLKNLELGLSTLNNLLIMGMVGTGVWMSTLIFAKSMKGESLSQSTFVLFSWMQVFTASGFAFSHGSNDIANAIGPFAAIIDVLKSGEVNSTANIPTVIMFTFGIGMVAGLWFIGREVILTVGTHLTTMHPASGFAAELSAAAVVLMASLLGIPVSSTHILIGAVLGVGLVNRQTNWALMKPIALAWVITLPAAAMLSAVFLLLFRLL